MATVLPHWDVSDVFPAIGSREYAAAREQFTADVARLSGLYEEHDVRGGHRREVDEAAVAAFESVLDATNGVMDQLRLLTAYLTASVATNSKDDLAEGEYSELLGDAAELSRLRTRFDAWVSSLGAPELVAASPMASDHAYPLARAEERAVHQMSEAEEGLLAELTLTGSSAWRRLHQTFTSQLRVPVTLADGSTSVVPMSTARGMASAADPSVRRAAYEAELATWEANSVPIIAALNGVKGEAAAVNRRRGWPDDLAPALAANGVDRVTLDAMHAAVVASFPEFRRYLRAKAALLGHDGGLPWYELFAPIGNAGGVSWQEATATVADNFASYSPGLGEVATRAVAGAWIDAEPRQGKRDGAFCMGVAGDRSLVLLNFDGSYRSVSTLAHELGHAYHNVTLANRTAMQRQLPMALAETASIFCETLLVQAGLAGTSDRDARLALLETDLQGACQVVVDIHSRFLFEAAFSEARARRTVSATEACALMDEAQEQTYGDGLDANLRHSYMWAAKPHYYSAAFYNWPYTFGLLFGVGLYARYLEDPERFTAGYDDLLSSCGLGPAAELAGRFGIDVRDEAFWASSLEVIRGRIDEFVSTAGLRPTPAAAG